jgi:hypothetical protein
VERTWQFVAGAARRLAGFLQEQVRRWLTGAAVGANASEVLGESARASEAGTAALPLSGGPIVKPPPQVIDLIVRLVYGALVAAVSSLMVLLFGAELAAIIMANPVAVVVILAVLALALLLLLLLVYLAFRWWHPGPPKTPTKRVLRVRPRRLELGVGGPDLRSAATLAPGSPARPPLTWTLNPGGTTPAGVSIVGSGSVVNVRAAHPAHGTRVGGLPVTVRAALTANPADFADSAPITLVQVLSANYVAAPALAAVPALIPGTPPPNTAEPNRDGLSGNTATVNVTTLPAGRPVGVAFRTALGARVSRTTITPGSRTGDLALRITDTATKARLDETLPSTAGPASFMAELTVNAVPTRVSALTGAGALGPYGVLNSITYASSDTLHPPLTRIVGELITNGGDDFNIPPPNGAFNPTFQLTLAVPANQWNDQLITPAGILHATNGRPAIDVNRFVGPGVPQLPRRLIYRQRFQYSAWHGAGTAISRTFADGRHIRSLIGTPPAAFQFRTEHVFGSVAAPPRNEPYAGNPLIVLSNLTVTPTAPGATALAADGASTATLGVTSSVAGRSVTWTVRGGGNGITAGNPAALPATATLTAGQRAGTFPLRSADTIFPNRRLDGSVRVVAVALRNLRATPNPAPAGTASVVITLDANPGGRTVRWSVDAASAAAGVTVTPNTTGPGAPAMTTTVTRPAGFTGTVTLTATDSVLASRTSGIRIRFQ